MANRPSPSLPPATVVVQSRPAATSASACPISSRWPGPVISTSHTSCPTTASSGRPNRCSAVTGQEVTSPRGPTVNAARPARSGSRRRGSPDLPAPANCDSNGICTNLDCEFAGLPSGISGQWPQSFRPAAVRHGQVLPVRLDIVRTRNVSHLRSQMVRPGRLLGDVLARPVAPLRSARARRTTQSWRGARELRARAAAQRANLIPRRTHRLPRSVPRSGPTGRESSKWSSCNLISRPSLRRDPA